MNLVHSLGGASSSLPVSFGSSVPSAMDPEADDPDVGRLQALLEARGIPPHVFGSLGKQQLKTKEIYLMVIYCLFYSTTHASSVAQNNRFE